MYGPFFKGLQARVSDRVMERAESPALNGVICGEGGIQRAFGSVKNTSVTDHVGYAAGFVRASSTYVKVVNGSSTFPLLGVRWTILGGFNATSITGDDYIFDRVVTVSGSPYHAPGLRINSSSQLVLEWTDSSGTDKSITSTNTVSTGTDYYFICRRIDDDLVLYVGVLGTSPTEWASGDGLGAADFPGDTGTHNFVIGANGTNGTPNSDHFDGFIDGVTVLELAVDELDMGYVEWPQPRMKRCLLMMPLEIAAASEFTDLSSHSSDYTITHHASVTHEDTAILASPTVTNFVGELVKPNSGQRINVIADGAFYASRAYS